MRSRDIGNTSYMYRDFWHNSIIGAHGGLNVDIGGGHALRLVSSTLRLMRPRVLAQMVLAVES